MLYLIDWEALMKDFPIIYRRRLWVAFGLVALISGGVAAEESLSPRREKKLSLKALRYAGFPTESGGQFLATDEQGTAYLFHTMQLGAYRLETDGTATRLFRLDRHDGIRAIAVGDRGRRWLFQDGEEGLRLVEGGVETEIEAPGTMLVGVGLASGEPVVATTPMYLTSGRPGLPLEGHPQESLAASSLLMSWDGKRWSRRVERSGNDIVTPEALRRYKLSGLETWMAVDKAGRVLLSPKTSYDARLYSLAGKKLDHLRVGGGERTFSKIGAAEQETLKQSGFAPPADYQRLDRRLHGLAFGRDQRLYFLVAAKEGLAIDRYDPALQMVDRVEIDVPSSDALRFAAGTDGLLIADVRDLGRVYLAEWQELEKAPWLPVADVELRPRD
jgi:hypothetical protein